jgi:hypothetical protein
MARCSQSFSFSERDIEDLRALAALRQESMSFVMREALRAYLREYLPGWREREEERLRPTGENGDNRASPL